MGKICQWAHGITGHHFYPFSSFVHGQGVHAYQWDHHANGLNPYTGRPTMEMLAHLHTIIGMPMGNGLHDWHANGPIGRH
jgi:hypothetical protein